MVWSIRFWTIGNHRKTERLCQLLGSTMVFLSQLPLFGGILLKHMDIHTDYK